MHLFAAHIERATETKNSEQDRGPRIESRERRVWRLGIELREVVLREMLWGGGRSRRMAGGRTASESRQGYSSGQRCMRA